MARTGRRTLLNPDTHERILAALDAGARYEDAAAFADISPATLYNWLKRGREEQDRLDREPEGTEPHPDEAPFLDLLEAVTRVNGRLAVYAAGHWKLAMRDDWRAAQAFLQARFPHWKMGEDGDGGEEQAEAALTMGQARILAATVQELLDGLDLTPEQRKAAPKLARQILTGQPAIEAAAREGAPPGRRGEKAS